MTGVKRLVKVLAVLRVVLCQLRDHIHQHERGRQTDGAVPHIAEVPDEERQADNDRTDRNRGDSGFSGCPLAVNAEYQRREQRFDQGIRENHQIVDVFPVHERYGNRYSTEQQNYHADNRGFGCLEFAVTDTDQQVLVDDRGHDHQQRICGGQTDRQYADEEHDHQNLREQTVRARDDVAHIRDNQFGFRAGKVRHGSQRDQTDEHRAAPDDDLQERCKERHLTLVLQTCAVIAGAYKDLRQQQRVAECTRKRIADARRIGAYADRTRIGEPVRCLHADGLECLDDRAVEYDLERYENNCPQRQNEEPALYSIRQCGGFYAAEHDEYRHDNAANERKRLRGYRAAGGYLSCTSAGYQYRRDKRHGADNVNNVDDNGQRLGLVAAEEEIRRGGEVLLLVDQPYLGHREVADDREHGVDAHFREEVAQSVAVIRARACKEHPYTHARGDVRHDHDRPLEPAALQIDLACVTFFLPCGVACDSDQK